MLLRPNTAVKLPLIVFEDPPITLKSLNGAIVDPDIMLLPPPTIDDPLLLNKVLQ